MSIGRLEVGTETLLDKSKSVKTVLMQLFKGNTDIEGVDTINACYGGTNALLNAINWVESSAWDGRDAVVVAGDIAVYGQGAARPTGGAGCVAMLIGPNAPIVVEPGLRGSHMDHTYDFYKADLTSEYALVDGQYSIECYLTALDRCYQVYLGRQRRMKEGRLPASSGCSNGHRNGADANGQTNGHVDRHVNGDSKEQVSEQANGMTNGRSNDRTNDCDEKTTLDQFDFMCFHSPTTKLVMKSYGRLLYNDYVANPEGALFVDVPQELLKLSTSESLTSKVVEKTFMKLAAKRFAARVQPSTLTGTVCGNMYTASLYGSLISLLCNVTSERLQGKRIGMFSFGSGLASTMFSLRIQGSVEMMAGIINLQRRLDARRVVTPESFVNACQLREKAHLQRDFVPSGDIGSLEPQTFYLEAVDSMFRRSYRIR
ncbi:hypothetical protein PRZ48_005358 [Zasmidium cellare]|uniref:Hydroxymethylglutaryl-CoA synthase n=1 Tax=Zasmidium cellare TaxID=395010 RepID=A0ABR0ESI0_ZASCE|nr:hypothetical protein PRZ48_005358 [Zasmidium cellare]